MSRPMSFLPAGAALLVTAFLLGTPGEAQRQLDVPYVPTPQPIVDKMLEMAEVTSSDYLIDLGSGDGRIPITAAQRYGISAYGVDLNPERIAEANANAKKAGVTDKVKFEEKNLFDTDISKATVLTLYLLPSVNMQLRPRILKELKPGTRVVSHSFDMGDWEADRTEKVDGKTLYKWVVPAQAEGSWQVKAEGGGSRDFKLELDQKFQTLNGTATIDGQKAPIKNARVEGDRIAFEIAAGDGKAQRYEGRINGSRIEGEGWQATRDS
jgi:hypothetical protein